MLNELIIERVTKINEEAAECEGLIHSILQDQEQAVEEANGFRKTLLRVFGLDSGLGRILRNYYLSGFLSKYLIDLNAEAEFYISLNKNTSHTQTPP